MSTSNSVYVVAVTKEEAEAAAAEYESHDDIEDAVSERVSLRASNGKNPYRIFKVCEAFDVVSEVEVYGKDIP